MKSTEGTLCIFQGVPRVRTKPLGPGRVRALACSVCGRKCVSMCSCRGPSCVLTRSKLRPELSCWVGDKEGRQVRGAGGRLRAFELIELA